MELKLPKGVSKADVAQFEHEHENDVADFPLEKPREFARLKIGGLMDYLLGGTKTTAAEKLYRDGLCRKITSRSNHFDV